MAFTFADARDDSAPFFEQTIQLSPGEAYYIIVGGDPNRREGQWPFELHLFEGVLESSPFGVMAAPQAISLVPDTPRFGHYWRGVNEGEFLGKINGHGSDMRTNIDSPISFSIGGRYCKV